MKLQENQVQKINSSQVTDSPSLRHTPSNLLSKPFLYTSFVECITFSVITFWLGGRNRKCNNRKCNNSLPVFE